MSLVLLTFIFWKLLELNSHVSLVLGMRIAMEVQCGDPKQATGEVVRLP